MNLSVCSMSLAPALSLSVNICPGVRPLEWTAQHPFDEACVGVCVGQKAVLEFLQMPKKGGKFASFYPCFTFSLFVFEYISYTVSPEDSISVSI